MRRMLAGLAALPVVVSLLSGCSGASKVSDSVISAASPREALAQSAEAMKETDYRLEYEVEEESGRDRLRGEISIARRGDDFSMVFDLDDQESGGFYILDGVMYACFAGDDTFAADSEPGCIAFPDVEGDDEDDSFPDEMNAALFNPIESLFQDLDDKDNLKYSDADERTVAGVEGRCISVTGTDTDATLCVALDSGLLLLAEGTIGGEPGKLVLKSKRDPKDADFQLPYEVVDQEDLLGGSDDVTYADREPKQPRDPGIPAIRIAGEPFPWEPAPALCPGIDLGFMPSDLLIRTGGGFAMIRSFDLVTVDRDCRETATALDAWEIASNRSGRIVGIDMDERGDRLVLVGSDGKDSPLAGALCAKAKDCKPVDGPASEAILGTINDLAVSEDGTVWFTSMNDAKRTGAELRRVAGGRVETVTLPSEIDVLMTITGGPGGSVIISDWIDAWVVNGAGRVERQIEAGDSCFALDRDGTIWSYDSFDGELTAAGPSGASQTFRFLPAEEIGCDSMLVDANGALLFLSDSFSTPPGLWRIPNPLDK